MKSLEADSNYNRELQLESKPGRYRVKFANRQLSNFKQMVPVGYEHWDNTKEKQRRIITIGLDRLLCLMGLHEREIREPCPEKGV